MAWYEIPTGARLWNKVLDVLAHGCETGIDSVIVIEIYEYIFQEIELIGGFLARI